VSEVLGVLEIARVVADDLVPGQNEDSEDVQDQKRREENRLALVVLGHLSFRTSRRGGE
jgi:hypothetical protein